MKTQAVLGAMVAGSIFAASAFGGCGSDPDNVFTEDGGNSSGTSGASGASGASGGCTGIGCGSNGDNGEGGTSGTSGTSGSPLEECATSTMGGSLLPIELTVVFDKSSSMCAVPGDPDKPTVFDCANEQTRWPATSTALKSFLTDQASAGLTVAVRSFGPVTKYPDNTVATNKCNASDYQTIEAGFGPTDLPSQPLADAVLAELPFFPNGEGNATMTQTGPAIAGATIYSQGRLTELAGTKGVAMLLISDGDPTGCGDNATTTTDGDKQQANAAAAAAAAAGIKVYVLNLGGNIQVLNNIAAAGGTTQAITIADPTNPAQIGAALAAIRGQTLSCEFAIPSPGGNLEPDYDKLNVTFTPPGGPVQVLPNTTDCTANPNGWQYDNPEAPTKIELCPAVCETVLASLTGKIDVVLGCETTKGGVH